MILEISEKHLETASIAINLDSFPAVDDPDSRPNIAAEKPPAYQADPCAG